MAKQMKQAGTKFKALFKKTEVKEVVRDLGKRIAADALEVLSAKIQDEINKAGKRATDNGRATIMPQDF